MTSSSSGRLCISSLNGEREIGSCAPVPGGFQPSMWGVFARTLHGFHFRIWCQKLGVNSVFLIFLLCERSGVERSKHRGGQVPGAPPVGQASTGRLATSCTLPPRNAPKHFKTLPNVSRHLS